MIKLPARPRAGSPPAAGLPTPASWPSRALPPPPISTKRWRNRTGAPTTLRAIDRIEAEPSLLGASHHLMTTATKP